MNNQDKPIRRPGAALTILLGTFFFFLCIFSLLSSFIMPRISNIVTATRLITIFQAIFLFIVPALITAMLSTRLPANFLSISQKPALKPSLLVIATIIIAIPLMNFIIEWNNNLHLPQSMHALEQTIRQLEEQATNATNAIFGPDTIGSLIVTILIVGIMAGLSEELFFRGALQRTLSSMSLTPNAAVWIAATIFSFMHFQFFGFVPRLLLGAFFGYILLWSNNLWYCVIAHATNNILATVTMWSTTHHNTNSTDTLSTLSSDNTTLSLLILISSIALTTLSLIYLKKILNKNIKKRDQTLAQNK
ncbi:MAG: CPBP family intramembrane metalloprotease [Clostridiales bacterium]|nr:CPBP family intramembrane metalloprotease [Clostridiales bacterium]